jgi:hypothetical protein
MQHDVNGYSCWEATWVAHGSDLVTLCDAVEPLDWLNGTDDKCITLLAVVAMHGTAAQFECALQRGCDPTGRILSDGQYGPPPVLFVFSAADPATILPKLQALARHGAPLNDTDDSSDTVYSLAAELEDDAARAAIQEWLAANHPTFTEFRMS